MPRIVASQVTGIDIDALSQDPASISKASLYADFVAGDYRVFTDTARTTDASFSDIFTFSRGSSASVPGTYGLGSVGTDQQRMTPGGFLVEDTSTNLLDHSEDLTQGTWVTQRVTINANTTAAPDRSITADEMVPDTQNATHYIFNLTDTLTSGTAYTISAFVKAKEYSKCRVQFNNNNGTFGGEDARFDLAAGTVISSTAEKASIESYGDGWYRISATQTALASNGAAVSFYTLDNAGSTNFIGNGSDSMWWWGLSLEAAAMPTSYISVGAGTATRSADVCDASIDGMFNPDNYSMFMEAEILDDALNSFPLGVHSGNANNRLAVAYPAGSPGVFRVIDSISGSTSTTDSADTGVREGDTVKVAWRYSASDNLIIVYVNGTQVFSLNPTIASGRFTTTSLNDVGGNQHATKIKKFALYPEALTNAELIEFTS